MLQKNNLFYKKLVYTDKIFKYFISMRTGVEKGYCFTEEFGNDFVLWNKSFCLCHDYRKMNQKITYKETFL